MTAILRHFYHCTVMEAVAFGVGARFQQKTNSLSVPFAGCKMDRRKVPELRAAEPGFLSIIRRRETISPREAAASTSQTSWPSGVWSSSGLSMAKDYGRRLLNSSAERSSVIVLDTSFERLISG